MVALQPEKEISSAVSSVPKINPNTVYVSRCDIHCLVPDMSVSSSQRNSSKIWSSVPLQTSPWATQPVAYSRFYFVYRLECSHLLHLVRVGAACVVILEEAEFFGYIAFS